MRKSKTDPFPINFTNWGSKLIVHVHVPQIYITPQKHPNFGLKITFTKCKLLSITPPPGFLTNSTNRSTTPRTCWWCHLYWSRCILLQHTLHPNSQHRYHSLALRERQVGFTVYLPNHGKFGVQYTRMAATLPQEIYNMFYFQRIVERQVCVNNCLGDVFVFRRGALGMGSYWRFFFGTKNWSWFLR